MASQELPPSFTIAINAALLPNSSLTPIVILLSISPFTPRILTIGLFMRYGVD